MNVLSIRTCFTQQSAQISYCLYKLWSHALLHNVMRQIWDHSTYFCLKIHIWKEDAWMFHGNDKFENMHEWRCRTVHVISKQSAALRGADGCLTAERALQSATWKGKASENNNIRETETDLNETNLKTWDWDQTHSPAAPEAPCVPAWTGQREY